VQRVKGLTWDHPRGYDALAAASRSPDLAADRLAIDWDKQPLENFESHPIADLCARYDLVVLDHPHLGEAVASGCLQPLEDLFDAAFVAELGPRAVGPTLASYGLDGRHWALPLDAATQVMALRPDLVEIPPDSWADVLALSGRTGRVALSLAGPHAFLTLLSLAVSLGELPAEADPARLFSEAVGLEALEMLGYLARRSPAATRPLNPIGILEHMSRNDDVLLCPLIYGYVNYAAIEGRGRIGFHDAPRIGPAGRRGTVLGGTGVGVTRRCEMTPALRRHLEWLMSDDCQRGFLPAHRGQPAMRAAWTDRQVDARAGGFYSQTLETIEQAYVRPRHPGYVTAQDEAAGVVRDYVDGARTAPQTLARISEVYAKSTPP
jgi:multiple sugar transport system substrate-binding protein